MINCLDKLVRLASVFHKYATERTLYHGTSINRARKIAKQGLIPQVGSWVSDSYGMDYDLDPEGEDYEGMYEKPTFDIVFAADKQELSKALGGMIATIAADSGKSFHEVTDEEIRQQGALLIMREATGYDDWKHVPKSEKGREQWEREQWEEGKTYPTAEPGDWISEEQQDVDIVLTGESMIRKLRQAGAWPRDWGPNQTKNRREILIKLLKQHHPNASINQIIQRVDSLSPKEREYYYLQARKNN